MPVKCKNCNKTNGKRNCPALNGLICPVCCATKRQVEIECPANCSYLENGIKNQMSKDLTRTIKETFMSEADDIFKDPRVVTELAAPIEMYLAANFFADKKVNDDRIYEILAKIYMILTKQTNESVLEDGYEKDISENINSIFDKSELSEEIKLKTILRILRSITKMPGGELGNRSYLRFIHGQFFR